MVRFKSTCAASVKKSGKSSKFQRIRNEENTPIPVRSGAKLDPHEKVIDLESIVEKVAKTTKRSTKPPQEKKKKQKTETEETDKKENDKKSNRVDWRKLGVLPHERCHHCRKPPFSVNVVKCQNWNCINHFCEQCLWDYYDLAGPEMKKKQKKEESDEDVEDSPTENSNFVAPDVQSDTQKNIWQCPQCQDICVCPKCRKKKGLEKVTKKAISLLKQKTQDQFNSLYDYFIFEREKRKKMKEEKEDEDENEENEEEEEEEEKEENSDDVGQTDDKIDDKEQDMEEQEDQSNNITSSLDVPSPKYDDSSEEANTDVIHLEMEDESDFEDLNEKRTTKKKSIEPAKEKVAAKNQKKKVPVQETKRKIDSYLFDDDDFEDPAKESKKKRRLSQKKNDSPKKKKVEENIDMESEEDPIENENEHAEKAQEEVEKEDEDSEKKNDSDDNFKVVEKEENGKEEMSESEDEDVYEVEEIIGKRKYRGKIQYQVKWKGYDEITWEPLKHLENCKESIRAYEEKQKQQ